MILDAGFLIAIDRGEQRAVAAVRAWERSAVQLHTTEPVVAQVWRSGAQVTLARLLNASNVHSLGDGRRLGVLLARSRTTDVVDAHLVDLGVRLRDEIVTGDPDDLGRIAAAAGPARPTIREWPPPRR